VSAAREGPFTTDRILAELSAERTLRALYGEPTRGRPPTGEEPAPREPPPWDGDPVPLSTRRLFPPFPVDALPGWVGDQVAAVAEATQTPPDLAGCIALAALSTAAGGRARVQVHQGWIEPVNIYTVVAMPPGSRKSAVFAAMIAPLLVAELQLVEATHPRLVDAELAARVARARAERTAKAAENARNVYGPAPGGRCRKWPPSRPHRARRIRPWWTPLLTRIRARSGTSLVALDHGTGARCRGRHLFAGVRPVQSNQWRACG
jgi:hypothetical protein